MNAYLAIKTLHILTSTILFGTGLGIAFFFYSHRKGDPAAAYFAARMTVHADFIFTLPAVILQPLTGFWLIAHSGFRWTESWLLATYVIYIIAGLCWIPVVFIQIKLKSILRNRLETNAPLPQSYAMLFRCWFLLGWPAFIGLIVVFCLMVAKP
jgi:uncharacterized membrane protein